MVKQRAGIGRRRMVLVNLIAGALLLSGAWMLERTASAEGEQGSLQRQIKKGELAFGSHCALCHGERGRGTDEGPALVGPKALSKEPPPGAKQRTSEFRTARDVLQFVRNEMPLNAPGSLSEDVYAAVTAWVLSQNDVPLAEPLDGEPLTMANAGGVPLRTSERRRP